MNKNSNLVLINQWPRYFLYFYIFLLKISSIGPSNLLKASLSIETILQSVVAFILACLTVFLTRAIYPK